VWSGQELPGGTGSSYFRPRHREERLQHSLRVRPQGGHTFNRNEEKVGHYVFSIDYRVRIPIRGGATVTMGAYDSNDVAIANHQHLVINWIPPAPAPFDGQFFQLDVESITPRN
jgi:hypothetical protein